jgi:hypothetical protein
MRPANRGAAVRRSRRQPRLAEIRRQRLRDAGGEREHYQRFAERVDQLDRRGLLDIEAFQ